MTAAHDSDAEPTQLTDEAEVLRRQVHPSWVKADGTPMSTAFRPGRADENQMSTLRERVPANEAHRRHVEAGLESAGTWGVLVGSAHAGGAVALDDAGIDGNPPDHASIDCRSMGKGAKERLGEALRDEAVTRGCLFVAPRVDTTS